MNPFAARNPIARANSPIDAATLFAENDNVEVYVAGTVLSGHRIVVTDTASGKAIYAQWNNNAHAHAAFKMTLQAALADADVRVKMSGRVEDPSFAYTPGDTLYLIANGQLSAILPTTGLGATFIRPVAVVETATRILLLQHPPIVLA